MTVGPECPQSLTTVLLVEDHPDVAELMCMMIERLGYRVAAARTVADALKLAEKESISVVLADFRLPDGNASDLLAKLKRRGPVRAILLTAADPRDLAAQWREGFVSCLQKPLDSKTLREAIEAAKNAVIPAG